MQAQRLDGDGRQQDRALTLPRLGRGEHEVPRLAAVERGRDTQDGGGEVDVPPVQRQQLPLSHARAERHEVERLQAVAARGIEERGHLLPRVDVHLASRGARRRHVVADVDGHEAESLGVLQHGVELGMRPQHGRGAHPLAVLAHDRRPAPRGVDPLHHRRRQLRELHLAERRQDVHAEQALVATIGGLFEVRLLHREPLLDELGEGLPLADERHPEVALVPRLREHPLGRVRRLAVANGPLLAVHGETHLVAIVPARDDGAFVLSAPLARHTPYPRLLSTYANRRAWMPAWIFRL